MWLTEDALIFTDCDSIILTGSMLFIHNGFWYPASLYLNEVLSLLIRICGILTGFIPLISQTVPFICVEQCFLIQRTSYIFSDLIDIDTLTVILSQSYQTMFSKLKSEKQSACLWVTVFGVFYTAIYPRWIVWFSGNLK